MVIRALGAARIIKDSTVITLEVAVGININSVGSIVVDGFSEFFNSNILDIVGMISSNWVLFSTLVNLAAMSIMGSVWIIIFKQQPPWVLMVSKARSAHPPLQSPIPQSISICSAIMIP